MLRTVGVVEPRVVVKIPWSKVQSQQQQQLQQDSPPSSNCGAVSPALDITSPSKVTSNCGGGVVGKGKGEERVLLEHPLLHPSSATQSPSPSISDVAASSPSSSSLPPSPKRCRHSRRGRGRGRGKGRRHHRCKKHKHTEDEEEEEESKEEEDEKKKKEEVGISFHRDKKRRKKQLEKKKEKKKKLLEEEEEQDLEEEGGGDHAAPLGPKEKASERLRLPHPHHQHKSDQIQHFHITETLPEHFKRALRSSQYGSSLLGDVYLDGGHQREEGERDVATISELKEVQSKQKVRVGGRDEGGSRDSQRQEVERGGELSQSVDETIKGRPKRRGRKRKQTSQMDVEEEEADSQMKENGKGKRGRRGRKARKEEEEVSNNRMNPLKLIIRTNQRGCVSVQEDVEKEERRSATRANDRVETRIEEDEEDVVEIAPSPPRNQDKKGGDEKVLVDLAAEEDQERNPYPIKGGVSGKEMEEYLRKRMPLLHVSIVKTKGGEEEKDDENKEGDVPVVRLKRLSPEQIESMAQGTAKKEGDSTRRGGEEEGEQLRSLQPLPDATAAEGLSERGGNDNNNMAGNLNNGRKERDDIYQTLECGRSLVEEEEDTTMQQKARESPSYRHSNKRGEKGGERVICADERGEEEEEEEGGNECGGSAVQHYKRSISNNKDDVEKVPLSHSGMAEWKLDEKSDKEKEEEGEAIGKANKEGKGVGGMGECSDDASSFAGVRDNSLDLQALTGNHDDCVRNGEESNDLVAHQDEEDSRSPAYALVTPDNGLSDADRNGVASNQDMVTGNDPMINAVVAAEANGRVNNLVDDDFIDIDSAFESLIGSSETGPNSLVSAHSDNSNGSHNSNPTHGSNMNMPILFSDDGNVQDFSTILNFQNFEMQAFDGATKKDQQGNNGNNNNSNPFLHNEANLASSSTSSGQSGDRLNENPSEKGREEETSADNGGEEKEEKKGNNKEIEGVDDDDDDNEVLCLTPPTPAKKRGRPRKYLPKSALERLREEDVDDDLVLLDSPPPSVSPSRVDKKRTTSIVSEDDDPADSIWMHCGRRNCEFYTRKPHRMDRHVLCHTADTRLKCPDCGEVFNSLPRMLRHDRREHGKGADYECKICEAEVTDINVHMRVS